MAIAVHGAGVKFQYGAETASTEIVGLMEIPEFAKPGKETIEVTCLTDKEKKYIPGIGDSINELTFKFLYDAKTFDTLNKLEGVQKCLLTLSDGSTFAFSGEFAMTYHGGGVNTAAEMSIVIAIEEAPVFTAVEAE